jgi:hypothetical protein
MNTFRPRLRGRIQLALQHLVLGSQPHELGGQLIGGGRVIGRGHVLVGVVVFSLRDRVLVGVRHGPVLGDDDRRHRFHLARVAVGRVGAASGVVVGVGCGRVRIAGRVVGRVAGRAGRRISVGVVGRAGGRGVGVVVLRVVRVAVDLRGLLITVSR